MPLVTTTGLAYPTSGSGSAARRTPINDMNYTATASDRLIAYTALSASRVVTLPAAASFYPGQRLAVIDESGFCSNSRQISLAPVGFDLINGVAAVSVISSAFGYLELESEGISKWTIIDAAIAPSANALLKVNNLSDVSDIGISRRTLFALKGYDTEAYAGSEFTQIASLLSAAASDTPFIYRASSHFGIIKDNAPLNYFGTHAAFVVQQRDSLGAGANILTPGAVFQFSSTGDGVVNAASNLSQTIWLGLYSVMTKTGDGSGQAFTATGQLGAYGTGLYNEIGLFQGSAANIGSLHGTMSGVEMALFDSPDNGVTHFDTTMNSVVGRVARFHNGASPCNNFFASSEGTIAPNSVLALNALGLKTWLRFLDLKDGIATTGQAILLPNNHSLAWMSSGGTPTAGMFVSGVDELWMATNSGISFANASLSVAFRIQPIVSAVNHVQANPSITGSPVSLQALGSDTNIDLTLAPKGAGFFNIGNATLSASATAGVNGAPPAQVSGYSKEKRNGAIVLIPYYNP